MLEEQQERRGDEGNGRYGKLPCAKTCPVCDGARLKKESLHFKVDNKNIFELACMDIRHPERNGSPTWKTGLPNARMLSLKRY
jgi:excinuclease ABC subunit A